MFGIPHAQQRVIGKVLLTSSSLSWARIEAENLTSIKKRRNEHDWSNYSEGVRDSARLVQKFGAKSYFVWFSHCLYSYLIRTADVVMCCNIIIVQYMEGAHHGFRKESGVS